MLAPWLQTDWLNRVVFDPAGTAPHVESFFFKANDPQHHRALWVRLTLFGKGKERYGQTWAIFFDRDRGLHRAATSFHPVDRLTIDPERGGVGIEESAAEENRSHGLVRGDDFVISWDLELVDELGPYVHLPYRWMYDSDLVGQKLVSPHPCASARGWVEVWEGTGPNSPVQRISLDGWRAMQGHNWGKRHTERYAWCHCNAFEEPGLREAAFFEGAFFQTAIAGVPIRGSIGRVVVGDDVYAFDTWRNILRARGRASPTRWDVHLEGPGGRLTGVVESRPQDVVALPYRNPAGPYAYCLNSKLASLRLRLEPRTGPARQLTSTRAALEVVQRDPNHGMPLAIPLDRAEPSPVQGAP